MPTTFLTSLWSRKLIVTVISAVLIIVSDKWLHLSPEAVAALTALAGAYILGQGYVDGKKAEGATAASTAADAAGIAKADPPAGNP